MLNKKQMIKQLAKLVSIRSLSGDIETNSKAIEYIQTLIDEKATIKRFKNSSGKASFETEILLISNISNASDKQLMNPEIGYLVHVDVVAGEEELWSMSLAEKSGKTIAKGRGVSDMKYSIPIGISLINELIAKNSNRTMTVAITTDEEVGGFGGGEYLADKLRFRPEILIVPDGGDMYKLIEKTKGVLQVKLTSTGAAAHASTPWKGKNAITDLVKVISTLLIKYQKNNFEENWKTTMNLGTIFGGISTNQVCDKAHLTIDFRFPESRSVKDIYQEVKEIAEKIDKTIIVKNIADGDPRYTNATSPLVRSFIQAINNNIDGSIEITKSYGASDARHFSKYNIPVLMTKPIGGDIHQNSEWINIDSCMQYMNGLMEFINDYKGLS